MDPSQGQNKGGKPPTEKVAKKAEYVFRTLCQDSFTLLCATLRGDDRACPRFQTSDDDVRHIDPAFTREPVPSSVGRSSTGRSGSTVSQRSLDRHFVGFSYDPGCDLHDGD